MAESTVQHPPHMHDLEGHVVAVEEDLEYFRTKRLEPRIIHLLRKGVISFHDLFQGVATTTPRHVPSKSTEGPERNTEARIRALEDALDEYARGLMLLSTVSGA